MKPITSTERPDLAARADLIARLDKALALATDLERQWKCVGEILDEHHALPLAA